MRFGILESWGQKMIKSTRAAGGRCRVSGHGQRRAALLQVDHIGGHLFRVANCTPHRARTGCRHANICAESSLQAEMQQLYRHCGCSDDRRMALVGWVVWLFGPKQEEQPV
jgi:hypothetical protein